MTLGATTKPAPVLFEDPPPQQVLDTFNSLLRGMTAGFIRWAGHAAGPVSDEKADEMLRRMAQAAARTANRVWGDESQPSSGAWPAL